MPRKKYESPYEDLFGKKSYNLTLENYYRSELRINMTTDGDVVKMLKSVPNKNEYIRDLIRDDIKRHDEKLQRRREYWRKRYQDKKREGK